MPNSLILPTVPLHSHLQIECFTPVPIFDRPYYHALISFVAVTINAMKKKLHSTITLYDQLASGTGDE